MSAFEPGDRWIAAASPSSVVGWPVVSSPKGQVICDMAWRPGLPPEVNATIKARANLIAAAPDMLSVLQDSVEILDVLIEDRERVIGEECEVARDLRRRVKEVIQQAQGQTAKAVGGGT